VHLRHSREPSAGRGARPLAVVQLATMIFNLLLLFVPVSIGLWLFGAPPLWVFATATASIVPLAEWTHRGTEQVALHAGPVVTGVLNPALFDITDIGSYSQERWKKP
jgi:Ca2+/H+ antiporter